MSAYAKANVSGLETYNQGVCENIVWEQNRQVFTPPFGEIFSLFSPGRNSNKFRKVFVELLD